jgi:hypothetical protein
MDCVHGGWCIGPWIALNQECPLYDLRSSLDQAKGYQISESQASIGQWTATGDSGQGVALSMAARPASGGGSPELVIYNTLGLGFR